MGRFKLYISSKDDRFYDDINLSISAGIPSWNSTAILAFMSLSHNINHLTPKADADIGKIKNKITLAISNRKSNFRNSTYHIPMSIGSNDFYWGQILLRQIHL